MLIQVARAEQPSDMSKQAVHGSMGSKLMTESPNNYPWPNSSDEQKTKIKQTAQAILDARTLFPEASLADLYDEATIPLELRKAHRENDKAVMAAYGFKPDLDESEIVAELFRMYQGMVKSIH